MIEWIYNKNEGRIRAIPRILLQLFVFVVLAAAIHNGTDAAVRSWFAAPVATEILGFDSTQFIAMFISIIWSILLSIWYLDRRPLSDIGVVREKSAWFDYSYGFLLSCFLVAVMFALELGCGAIKISSLNFSQLSQARFGIGILDGLCACMMIGFHEELLRFYQIRNLSEGLGRFKPLNRAGAIIVSTIIASVFFGALHGANNGITPQAVLFLTLDGLFLSLIYIFTGRGWLAFGFHAGWDFSEGNLFGYPVSGYPETYSLIKIEQTGANALTGGAFGPDGGLINLVMIVLGSALILAWICLRYGKPALKLDICNWVSPKAQPLKADEAQIPGSAAY